MNLIINASEAIGDRNGAISVSADVVRYDSDGLQASGLASDLAPGSHLCLAVTDTGCGMDPATQARIFEPFFTTKFTGRGLGLSAVMGIVKTHEGALRVGSEPGKGTTFRIFFPASDARPKGASVRGLAQHADWKGKGVVLLADDEEMLRKLGGRMLKEMGFTVLTAANGREAVDLYRERGSEIDIVILDMTMPVMNGAEAFNELSRLNPDICVVIASGHVTEDITVCFEGVSPAGFLQKPFTLGRLNELLATLTTKPACQTDVPAETEARS
jgi:CheY-like chemotaxis protein